MVAGQRGSAPHTISLEKGGRPSKGLLMWPISLLHVDARGRIAACRASERPGKHKHPTPPPYRQ